MFGKVIVDIFCRQWSFRHREFAERPHCGLVRMGMVKRPVVEPVLCGGTLSLLSSGTDVLCARVEHTGLLSLSRGRRVSTFLRTLFRLHRHQHVFLATRHRTRSRETFVASSLCSVGATRHTSHWHGRHRCDLLQNPGARRPRVTCELLQCWSRRSPCCCWYRVCVCGRKDGPSWNRGVNFASVAHLHLQRTSNEGVCEFAAVCACGASVFHSHDTGG